MKKRMLVVLLLSVTILLSACQLRTVDQMYRVPKRPQSYDDLQSVLDEAMGAMEYSAPRAGEHQQTVQIQTWLFPPCLFPEAPQSGVPL